MSTQKKTSWLEFGWKSFAMGDKWVVRLITYSFRAKQLSRLLCIRVVYCGELVKYIPLPLNVYHRWWVPSPLPVTVNFINSTCVKMGLTETLRQRPGYGRSEESSGVCLCVLSEIYRILIWRYNTRLALGFPP